MLAGLLDFWSGLGLFPALLLGFAVRVSLERFRSSCVRHKKPRSGYLPGFYLVAGAGFERFSASASGIALFVGALVSLKSVSVSNKKPRQDI